MRLSLILCLISVLQTSAAVFSQKVSIDVKNQSMREVLRKIETQSQYRFFYNDQLSGLNHSVTLKADNQNVNVILDLLLANQELSYKMLENNMIVIAPNEIAQQLKVSGIVTDAISGEALIGVSVAVEGTTMGTITDMNGSFTIEVPNGNVTLLLSYVGYITEKVALSGKSSITAKMSPDIKNLDEVVVVGYGVQKKKLVTGATVQVSGENIQKLSTVSPLTALQSQTPGVNIVQNNGEPGAGFKVNIRGVGTIGNSQPLYIVDGAARGDINYLTPSDIESIDILKDAASAAIYGARAANGVVLVTTKKGKAGKVTFSYDGYIGAQNVYKILPMLDAKEYMLIQNEGNVNSGGTPYDATFWNKNLAPGEYDKIMNGTYNGTNWLKQMQNKNAPIESHAFTIAGGNDHSVFSIGFSYLNQDGIFGAPVPSKYTRYTFRINSDHVLIRNKFDILKIGENVSFTYNTNRGLALQGFYWNNFRNAESALPILPMYADDPTDKAAPYHSPIAFNTNYSNPNADMYYRGFSTNFNINMNANVFLEFQPIKGLKYRSSYTVNPSAYTSRSYTPIYYLGPVNQSTTDNTTQSAGGGIGSWVFENTLNYEFTLLNDNHFNFLVGTSAEKGGLGTDLSVSNSGNVFGDYTHGYISNASVASTATISGNPWGPGLLNSYFGRVNYDYKEKYMLTLVMRSDGSSNFARGHRWSTFPSVSAGWVLSKESFMESSKSVLDFLKLRGSWGQNGNQTIAPFQYVANIAYSTPDYRANYYFGSNKLSPNPSLGAYPQNIASPDLKWETSEQLDLGLDARFLNSRLTLAVDYYVKTTKDWLVKAPVLASWGINPDFAPNINGGEISNKGIEIALGFNDHAGDFKYGVNVNYSYNKNNVTTIKNSSHFISAPNVKLWGNGPYIARAEEGHPIGYFWGYHTAGIFQTLEDVANYKNSKGIVIMPSAQPGDVKFVDANDDGVIDDRDKGQIGDPNPHHIYSLNFNGQYKGFDFTIATFGVAGNQIARSWHDAGSVNDNYTTEILGRWHGVGSSNKLPRLLNSSSINQQYTSDLSIENGDYFRISNVTVGYDFNNLIKINGVNQFRLFFTVQNLYTFTKYSGMDPAVGTGTDDTNTPWARGVDIGFYPNPRTIMVGASLKF